MRFESIGKEILFNGKTTSQDTLAEVCKKYFSAASWDKLWQDIEKYGRVHVAVVFVGKGKRD